MIVEATQQFKTAKGVICKFKYILVHVDKELWFFQNYGKNMNWVSLVLINTFLIE